MGTVLLFALHVIALVSARQYCQTGKTCAQSSDCMQMTFPPQSSGDCCNGKCVQGYPSLQRGASCSSLAPCAGVCRGSCINDVCTESVHAGCGCKQNADCASSMCDTSGSEGVCLWPHLGYGAPCKSDWQCDSQDCTNGTCLGRDRLVGWSCQLDSECRTDYCNQAVCSLSPEGARCQSSDGCVSGLVCKGAPGECSKPTEVGMDCSEYDECVTAASCVQVDDANTTKVCKQQAAIGGICSQYAPCMSNATCSGGKCIELYSLPLNSPCESPIDCIKNTVCSTTTTNASDTHCIAIHSVAVGGSCTLTSACVDGSQCSSMVCGPNVKQVSCDVNSSLSDSVQCDNFNAYCGCDNKCSLSADMIVSATTTKCYDKNQAYKKVPTNIPGSMTQEQQRLFADFTCCSFCIDDKQAFPDDTTNNGYVVDCAKGTVSLSTACYTNKSTGVHTFQNCKAYVDKNAAISATANHLAVLFLSLLSLSLFY